MYKELYFQLRLHLLFQPDTFEMKLNSLVVYSDSEVSDMEIVDSDEISDCDESSDSCSDYSEDFEPPKSEEVITDSDTDGGETDTDDSDGEEVDQLEVVGTAVDLPLEESDCYSDSDSSSDSDYKADEWTDSDSEDYESDDSDESDDGFDLEEEYEMAVTAPDGDWVNSTFFEYLYDRYFEMLLTFGENQQFDPNEWIDLILNVDGCYIVKESRRRCAICDCCGEWRMVSWTFKIGGYTINTGPRCAANLRKALDAIQAIHFATEGGMGRFPLINTLYDTWVADSDRLVDEAEELALNKKTRIGKRTRDFSTGDQKKRCRFN